jgi:outer membrane immunogenic protein
MKLIHFTAALAACLSLGSGGAAAADYTSGPIASSGWSGLFIGLHAGYTWGTPSWDVGPGSAVIEPDTDGFSGGALAGYNFQINQIVLGVEADITGGGLKDGPRFFPALGGTQSAEINYIATLRARLGYDMGNWMPFVTAGLGVADLELFDSFGGGPNSDSQTLTGFVVGGGAEFKLDSLFSTGTNGNLIGRVEYMYGDYGSKNFQIGGTPEPSDLKTHTLRAALIWRFP